MISQNTPRILLVGGCGFIGSHLTARFLKQTDWTVTILDRLDATVSLERLEEQGLLKYLNNRLEFVYWDLKAELNEQVSKQLGQFDYIIHCAAQSHVDRSVVNPLEFVADNVVGTANLLDWVRRTQPQLKRALLYSTDEVLGEAEYDQYFKETDCLKPSNPYSGSKAAAEMLATGFAITYSIPITVIRSVNIADKFQHPEKYIPLVIKKILNRETILIHANSTKNLSGARYYLNCDEVFSALFFLLNNSETEIITKSPRDSGIYNLIGNCKLSNLELAELIHITICTYYRDTTIPFNRELVSYHEARPYHDSLLYQLDNSKLQRLGWESKVEIKDSIKETVVWYLEHQDYL